MKNRSENVTLRFGLVWLSLLLAEVVACKLALELFNAAGGVDELLLTGEERVTLVADVHVDALGSALGGELVTTSARDFTVNVFGMDASFHDLPRCGQMIRAIVYTNLAVATGL
jgi:hypothetical protein